MNRPTRVFSQDVMNLEDLERAIAAVKNLGIKLSDVSTMNPSTIGGYAEPTCMFTVDSHVANDGLTIYTAELG